MVTLNLTPGLTFKQLSSALGVLCPLLRPLRGLPGHPWLSLPLGCPPWPPRPLLLATWSCLLTLWEEEWPGRLGIESLNSQSPNHDQRFGRDEGAWGGGSGHSSSGPLSLHAVDILSRVMFVLGAGGAAPGAVAI